MLKRHVKSIRNIFADPFPRNKVIEFSKYEMSNQGIKFYYSAKGSEYVACLDLGFDLNNKIEDIDEAALRNAVTAIGVFYIPFFFKLSDFKKVKIKAAPIDNETVSFFEGYLAKGLCQFRYLQGLNPNRHIEVEAEKKYIRDEASRCETEDHVLMLNGGGKDTIVAGELLLASGQPFTWLAVRTNEARKAVVELSGNISSIDVWYSLDKGIEKDKVYSWGHFPHTSVVLGIGVLVALIKNFRYVAVGNEFSSNFGNVNYKGSELNHQYTKSFEFEKGFSDYVKRCITPDIDAFSILRPFYDLRLAKFFSNNKKYFKRFNSCNVGISSNKWCKKCSKCAYTALALYPFLGEKGVVEIFNEDVVLRKEIRDHIMSLVSGDEKPWECVGVKDECQLALAMMLKLHPDLEFKEAPYRKDLENAIADIDVDELNERILESTQPEHLIPERVKRKINDFLLNDGKVTIK